MDIEKATAASGWPADFSFAGLPVDLFFIKIIIYDISFTTYECYNLGAAE